MFQSSVFTDCLDFINLYSSLYNSYNSLNIPWSSIGLDGAGSSVCKMYVSFFPSTSPTLPASPLTLTSLPPSPSPSSSSHPAPCTSSTSSSFSFLSSSCYHLYLSTFSSSSSFSLRHIYIQALSSCREGGNSDCCCPPRRVLRPPESVPVWYLRIPAALHQSSLRRRWALGIEGASHVRGLLLQLFGTNRCSLFFFFFCVWCGMVWRGV